MIEIRKIFVVLAVAMLMLPACGSRQVPSAPDSVSSASSPAQGASVSESITLPEGFSAEMLAVAVDSINAKYDSDWNTLSMQGKLDFTGLPMRVNVKVFMMRGKSIILSARAPLFGEVARVEVCPDSIILINKHSRCYNVQPLGGLKVDRVAYISDLQDILLGRVAFPGFGRLTPSMAAQSQWMVLPADETVIYPSQSFQTEGSDYGFVMDSASWDLKTFVLILKQAGVVIRTGYLYGRGGWTLALDIEINGKKMNGEVELSYPEYEVAPMDFTKLGDKYRRVDVKQLLKF